MNFGDIMWKPTIMSLKQRRTKFLTPHWEPPSCPCSLIDLYFINTTYHKCYSTKRELTKLLKLSLDTRLTCTRVTRTKALLEILEQPKKHMDSEMHCDPKTPAHSNILPAVCEKNIFHFFHSSASRKPHLNQE